MILSTKINGFEMKASVSEEGRRSFVVLPGLSPRSIMPSAQAVERAYATKLKDARVCLLDRREEVPEGYTIAQMADDTAVVLKELGIRKAAVFGASMGGMIAQMLAIRHPELVSALVLASSTSKINPSLRAVIERWAALAESGAGDVLADDMIGTIFSKALAERFGSILTSGMRGLTEAELRRFATLANACLDYDAEPQLGTVSCPVLVLGAEGDRVMTADASRRLAELTGGEIYLYGPEYDHAVYDETSDFAARVAAFVNRTFGAEE